MRGGTWPPTALRTTRLTTQFKARLTAGSWPLLLWLLALLFTAWPAPADAKPVPVPALTSRVIDQTKTLTPEETDALRGDIVALENQTQAQVAVPGPAPQSSKDAGAKSGRTSASALRLAVTAA